jgi:hypothetical protein
MLLRVDASHFLRELVVTDVGWMLPHSGASAPNFLSLLAEKKFVDAPPTRELSLWLNSPAAAFFGVVSCKELRRVHYYKTNPSLARGRLQDFPMVEQAEPRGAPPDAVERSESATEPSAPAITSSTSSCGATRSHDDAIPAGETPVGRGNRTPDDIIMVTQAARRLFRSVSSVSIYE